METPPTGACRYTYGDYRRWCDEVRCELMNGEVWRHPHSPGIAHQDIVGSLYCQLRNALGDKPDEVLISPVDVRLPRGDEADDDIDTVVQPDVVLVCDPTKIDRRGVREYWLVHPTDRTLTVHRLVDGRYGIPEISELKGRTALAILPEVTIAWDALVARLPAVEA